MGTEPGRGGAGRGKSGAVAGQQGWGGGEREWQCDSGMLARTSEFPVSELPCVVTPGLQGHSTTGGVLTKSKFGEAPAGGPGGEVTRPL